jgi:hypothetical protein
MSIFYGVMRKKSPTSSLGISTNVTFGATDDAEDLDQF